MPPPADADRADLLLAALSDDDLRLLRPHIERAGDSYGQPEAEYRRLIGPFGR